MKDSNKTLIVALLLALFSVTGLQAIQYYNTSRVLGETAPPPVPTCKVGQKRCNGGGTQQCDRGGVWGPIVKCSTGYICKEGNCVYSTPTSIPRPSNSQAIPCQEIKRLEALYCSGVGPTYPVPPTSTPRPSTTSCKTGVNTLSYQKTCTTEAGKIGDYYALYKCYNMTGGQIYDGLCRTAEEFKALAEEKCRGLSNCPQGQTCQYGRCLTIPTTVPTRTVSATPTPENTCNLAYDRPSGCACQKPGQCKSGSCSVGRCK